MAKPLDEIMAEGAVKAHEWSSFWSVEDARALMRAALAALEEEGYVVVPVNPTKAMTEAADGGNDTDWANEYIYMSMVYQTLGLNYNWRTGTTSPIAAPAVRSEAKSLPHGVSHPQAPYTPEPRKEES